MGRTPDLRGSLAWLLAAGVAHAMLSLWLYLDGHAPSHSPLPEGTSHYFWQALFVLPLLLIQWRLLAWAVHRLLRHRSIAESVSQTRRVCGMVLGLSLLICLVIPDAAVYALWGFDGLTQAVRYTMPSLVLVSWAWLTRELSTIYAARWSARTAVAFAGLLAQAIPGGLLLR